MTDVPKLAFRVNTARGDAPDLSGLAIDARTLLDGLAFQPGATAFVTGVWMSETMPTCFRLCFSRTRSYLP